MATMRYIAETQVDWQMQPPAMDMDGMDTNEQPDIEWQCFGGGVKNVREVSYMFVDWMKRNPLRGHEQAPYLLVEASIEAWPCWTEPTEMEGGR